MRVRGASRNRRQPCGSGGTGRVPPSSGVEVVSAETRATLDDAVRAMGHPGRRAMLRLAREEERTASDLARAGGVKRSGGRENVAKHEAIARDDLAELNLDRRRKAGAVV